jgi:hypothetical protein
MGSRGSALCCAIALVAVASGSLRDAEANQQSPQPAARRAPAIAFSPDGKLSVTVTRVSLRRVLQEIERGARVEIVLSDDFADRPVSLDIRDVPVDEGLKRLLTAYDAFFLYSADDKAPGSIKTVWVFDRGQGRHLQPVPPEQWASTGELEKQLEDPDPGVRGDTYEALIERQGERGWEMARKGLSDPDETVRSRSLSAAIDADIDIPARELEPLILDGYGQSRGMRILALQAIAGKPEARAIAVTLKNDPDELVRRVAEQILQGQ